MRRAMTQATPTQILRTSHKKKKDNATLGRYRRVMIEVSRKQRCNSWLKLFFFPSQILCTPPHWQVEYATETTREIYGMHHPASRQNREKVMECLVIGGFCARELCIDGERRNRASPKKAGVLGLAFFSYYSASKMLTCDSFMLCTCVRVMILCQFQFGRFHGASPEVRSWNFLFLFLFLRLFYFVPVYSIYVGNDVYHLKPFLFWRPALCRWSWAWECGWLCVMMPARCRWGWVYAWGILAAKHWVLNIAEYRGAAAY